MNWLKAGLVSALAFVFMASVAEAAKCGNTSAGFEKWEMAFATEAKANGIKPKAISSLMATSYSKGTIKADRGQHNFKLSLNAFMVKRGASGIIARTPTGDMGHGDGFRRFYWEPEYAFGGGNAGL